MYVRKFMEVNEESLKAPIVLAGLPGIANVGKIAIETLIQLLDAEHLMDFFSKDFPPRVTVQKGLTFIPKSSVHLYRAAPDEPHDVLFLTADYQPSSTTGVYEYADFVAREFVNLKVETIYSLAAYEQDYVEYFKFYPSSPRVYVSSSSQRILDTLSNLDGTIITEEGVIVGANGVIPSWAASIYNMDGACLLGETLGVIKVDYRAAKALLAKVSTLIGIDMDLDVMDSHILKVIEFIEWARQELEKKRETSEDGESPSDMYIG
ncbi:hypothetical protein EU527_05705 [Candidatus Thorarchaeota archaeon]|nr:MAG: hypothetical protein EU527_05705 [Candidatus Thorarchaeota archaeon]